MLFGSARVRAALWMAATAVWPAPQASSASKSPFHLGADISSLAQVEARGGVCLDGGQPGDAPAIFMKHGCFRLRIWVDPRSGANGPEYAAKPARRIKAAGASFMLDFHYSDNWADLQKQFKPAAWAKLDFDALVTQTESYTADVIGRLRPRELRPISCRSAMRSPAARCGPMPRSRFRSPP